MRSTTPHDRAVDRGPAKAGYTDRGKVLGRDVPGSIEVGVELVAALAAPEYRPGAPVVAGGMPAGVAHLGGMPGVYAGHRYALLIGLVLDEGLQLSERPSVQAAGLSPVVDLDATADVLEVLQHHGSARRAGGDDLFGEDVVAVTAEASLSAAHDSQVALSGLGPLGLQSAAQVEVAALDCSPTLLAEEAVVGGDGRLGQAKINADDLGVRSYLGSWQVNNDVQPPLVCSLNQVGGEDRCADVLLGIARDAEGDGHASYNSGKANGSLRPVDLERVRVEARRTLSRFRTGYLPALTLQNKGAPQGFGGLQAGLAVQVGDEGGMGFLQRVVGGVVETHTVLLVVGPAVGADRVEDRSEEPGGLSERGDLFGGRLEKDLDGSIHSKSIPYTPLFCKAKGGKRHSPVA